MAAPIRIRLATHREGVSLIQTLAAHGLTAHFVSPDPSSSEIELRYRHEATGLLLRDVNGALETWSPGEPHAAAVVVVNEGEGVRLAPRRPRRAPGTRKRAGHRLLLSVD